MKTWQKSIALLLAFLHLFGCAQQSYRADNDAAEQYDVLQAHVLKATGNNAAWVDGYYVALSNDLKLPIKIRFLYSGPAGLVFLIGMSNQSNKKLLVSSKNFYCRQKNSQSAQGIWPVLSIKQVMANFDEQIKVFEPVEQSVLVSAAQIAIIVIMVILILAILSKAGGSSGSWRWPSTDTSHSSTPSSSEAIRQLRILKHQQQELLLSSKTLHAGESLSAQIVCPFKSLGDTGLYIVYREFLFEYDRVAAQAEKGHIKN